MPAPVWSVQSDNAAAGRVVSVMSSPEFMAGGS